MRVIAISDTHGCHARLRVPHGDVLVHAGDISERGKPSEVKDFLDWFARQPHPHKIFIAGNHDFLFERNPQLALSMIPSNVTYLQDSGITIGKLNIWGSPVTPWFHNWAFNRRRGEDILRHWQLIPPDTNFLITHGPPYGFLDQVISDDHAGCVDLQRTVLTLKPLVHVFGHIHESYGSIARMGTRYINASVLDEGYRLRHQPWVLNV